MPTPSFLPEPKHALLSELVTQLDSQSLTWLSGYFAGLAHERRDPVVMQPGTVPGLATPTFTAPTQRVTIIFGSQTGNAQKVAERLAAEMRGKGLQLRLVRADRYPNKELKDERLLLIVISTQGEGDPPDDSLAFVEFLNGRRAPALPGLKFAVLGLGDSSYPEFCGIATKIDQRLEALGATRLHPVGLADLDIDTVALPWQTAAVSLAAKELHAPTLHTATVTPLHPKSARYDRAHPYQAEVVLNQRLTGRGSTKDIRHIELAIEAGHLHYSPGDTLGVWPQQDAELVKQIIDQLRLNPEETIDIDGETRSLQEWLTRHRELTVLTRPFLEAHARRAQHAELNNLLDPERAEHVRKSLATWQPIDLLSRFPAHWSAQDLLRALRPLTPRLYSIASSQRAVGDEVHLTLANVAYEYEGESRWGVTSRFLASLQEGDTLPVFIEENTRFRLPQDTSKDIIMIGPGTGVAPFRAFVQERAEQGASGRNWLFFGNPHFQTDFLYQTEWLRALEAGLLHRLDLAFSRDQAQKIYVQNKLQEQGAQIYDWLRHGAHVYVCGDATHMAKDVHQTLLNIASEHGAMDQEQAQEWLSALAAEGRYARDVY